MDFVYVKLTFTILTILIVKVLSEAINPNLLTEDMYCKLNCLDYFDRDDLKLTPKTIQCRCPILQVEIDGEIQNVPRCRQPQKACLNTQNAFLPQTISKQTKGFLLHRINEFRNFIAAGVWKGQNHNKYFPVATNMKVVKWNAELEQIAKWKSMTCAMEKVCVRAKFTPRTRHWAFSAINGPRMFYDITARWFDLSINKFDNNAFGQQFNIFIAMDDVHLQMLLFYGFEKIGCAGHTFKHSKNHTLRYGLDCIVGPGPPNFDYQNNYVKLYDVGGPGTDELTYANLSATNCPEGYQRDVIYLNLCSDGREPAELFIPENTSLVDITTAYEIPQHITIKKNQSMLNSSINFIQPTNSLNPSRIFSEPLNSLRTDSNLIQDLKSQTVKATEATKGSDQSASPIFFTLPSTSLRFVTMIQRNDNNQIPFRVIVQTLTLLTSDNHGQQLASEPQTYNHTMLDATTKIKALLDVVPLHSSNETMGAKVVTQLEPIDFLFKTVRSQKNPENDPSKFMMGVTDMTESNWDSIDSKKSGPVATKEATSTTIIPPLSSRYLSVGEIQTGNFSVPLNSMRDYSKLSQKQNIQTVELNQPTKDLHKSTSSTFSILPSLSLRYVTMVQRNDKDPDPFRVIVQTLTLWNSSRIEEHLVSEILNSNHTMLDETTKIGASLDVVTSDETMSSKEATKLAPIDFLLKTVRSQEIRIKEPSKFTIRATDVIVPFFSGFDSKKLEATKEATSITPPLPSSYLSISEIQTSPYKSFKAGEIASTSVVDPLSSDILVLLTNKSSLKLQGEVLESQTRAMDLMTKDLLIQVLMQKIGDSLAFTTFFAGHPLPHFGANQTIRPKDSEPSITSTMQSVSAQKVSGHNQDVEANEGVLPHLRLFTEDLEPADSTESTIANDMQNTQPEGPEMIWLPSTSTKVTFKSDSAKKVENFEELDPLKWDNVNQVVGPGVQIPKVVHQTVSWEALPELYEVPQQITIKKDKSMLNASINFIQPTNSLLQQATRTFNNLSLYQNTQTVKANEATKGSSKSTSSTFSTLPSTSLRYVTMIQRNDSDQIPFRVIVQTLTLLKNDNQVVGPGYQIPQVVHQTVPWEVLPEFSPSRAVIEKLDDKIEKSFEKLTYPLTFHLAEHRTIQTEIPRWLSSTTSKLKIHFEGAETNDYRPGQKGFEISHSTSSLQTVYSKVLSEPNPSRILTEKPIDITGRLTNLVSTFANNLEKNVGNFKSAKTVIVSDVPTMTNEVITPNTKWISIDSTKPTEATWKQKIGSTIPAQTETLISETRVQVKAVKTTMEVSTTTVDKSVSLESPSLVLSQNFVDKEVKNKKPFGSDFGVSLDLLDSGVLELYTGLWKWKNPVQPSLKYSVEFEPERNLETVKYEVSMDLNEKEKSTINQAKTSVYKISDDLDESTTKLIDNTQTFNVTTISSPAIDRKYMTPNVMPTKCSITYVTITETIEKPEPLIHPSSTCIRDSYYSIYTDYLRLLASTNSLRATRSRIKVKVIHKTTTRTVTSTVTLAEKVGGETVTVTMLPHTGRLTVTIPPTGSQIYDVESTRKIMH